MKLELPKKFNYPKGSEKSKRNLVRRAHKLCANNAF